MSFNASITSQCPMKLPEKTVFASTIVRHKKNLEHKLMISFLILISYQTNSITFMLTIIK